MRAPLRGAIGAVQSWLYDLEMRLAASQLNPRRRAVAGNAKGLVLELGVGTAQNAPFYDPSSRVVGIDPDRSMLARARKRMARASGRLNLVAALGEALPFAPACFDSAVVTLTLCSVESQERTLNELHRVLKPGAKLHFMEHIRSDAAGWAKLQDVLTPFWKTVASG